jgi:5-methyltetrahydrofolate--homocysteine methyltransferase
MIGANVDDTITYPPFFRDHILPWQKEAASILHQAGKLLVCHTDGENEGLMDYIAESGLDLADSVCPAPMTKVSMDVYYDKWCDRITIQGGIPSNLVLPAATEEEEFETYLDYLFEAVAPGRRLILGIADAVPPDADFSRLERIAERLQQQGELPWSTPARRLARSGPETYEDEKPGDMLLQSDTIFQELQKDIFRGNHQDIGVHVRKLLDGGQEATDILNRAMLPAMEIIGERFKTGELFMPEVLMAARAMNMGLEVLEPYLAEQRQEAKGLVLMGTVKGDLHDIGKNMVSTMLRGVGFEVRDAGMDVPADKFVKLVAEMNPHILGLSALLTTTMPQMKTVIRALAEAGLRDKVKVIVGGAPVSETFARQIGADGFAQDAGEAVGLAKRLIKN